MAANPEVSPAVASNPDLADLHRETGQRNNEIQKVVVSDSLTGDDKAPWTDTTTIVRRADAHQAVAELKDRPGKEILMFGSWTLWNDLLVAGLIDELRLMVGAAVLGGDPGLRRRGGPADAAGEHQAPGWLGQPAAAIRGGQPRRMMSRSPCGQGRTLRETVRGRDSRKSPGMPN